MTARAPTVLVGFGMMGAGFANDKRMSAHFTYASHAQVLRDHPSFDWLAVADPSPDARAAAALWDIPVVVPRVTDLPANFQTDVAVIATGPEERDQTLAALNGLKLAIIEKPLGTDAKAAAALLAKCTHRQIAIQVNLFRRADPSTRALADGSLEAHIGTPQAIFGVYGNGLRNNAIHMIDLIRMLAGDVIAVRALQSGDLVGDTPITGDVALPFALTLDSGVSAILQPLDFAHYREVGLDIWGTKGRLEILQEGLLMRVSPKVPHRALTANYEVNSETAETISSDYGHALYALYDNAAAWLANETALVSPGANALIDERIVDALISSAEHGGMEMELTL